MLSSGLADLVQDDGLLILSGILADQLPHLIELAGEKGLGSVEIRGQGEWRAVVLGK
jgi:ribosomal protein L11 methylase PrmA